MPRRNRNSSKHKTRRSRQRWQKKWRKSSKLAAQNEEEQGKLKEQVKKNQMKFEASKNKFSAAIEGKQVFRKEVKAQREQTMEEKRLGMQKVLDEHKKNEEKLRIDRQYI